MSLDDITIGNEYDGSVITRLKETRTEQGRNLRIRKEFTLENGEIKVLEEVIKKEEFMTAEEQAKKKEDEARRLEKKKSKEIAVGNDYGGSKILKIKEKRTEQGQYIRIRKEITLASGVIMIAEEIINKGKEKEKEETAEEVAKREKDAARRLEKEKATDDMIRAPMRRAASMNDGSSKPGSKRNVRRSASGRAKDSSKRKLLEETSSKAPTEAMEHLQKAEKVLEESSNSIVEEKSPKAPTEAIEQVQEAEKDPKGSSSSIVEETSSKAPAEATEQVQGAEKDLEGSSSSLKFDVGESLGSLQPDGGSHSSLKSDGGSRSSLKSNGGSKSSLKADRESQSSLKHEQEEEESLGEMLEDDDLDDLNNQEFTKQSVQRQRTGSDDSGSSFSNAMNVWKKGDSISSIGSLTKEEEYRKPPLGRTRSNDSSFSNAMNAWGERTKKSGNAPPFPTPMSPSRKSPVPERHTKPKFQVKIPDEAHHTAEVPKSPIKPSSGHGSIPRSPIKSPIKSWSGHGSIPRSPTKSFVKSSRQGSTRTVETKADGHQQAEAEKAKVEARKEAEELARVEAENARKAAEEREKKQEETAGLEAEKMAILEAEAETARLDEFMASLAAKKTVQLEAKKVIKVAEEKVAEKAVMLEAKKAVKAAEEKVERQAEDEARLEAENASKLDAEERQRQQAEEKARLAAEESERVAAERARVAAERAQAEAEAERKDAEERDRKQIEEKARLEADEKANLEEEKEAAKARLAAENSARLKVAEEKRDKEERLVTGFSSALGIWSAREQTKYGKVIPFSVLKAKAPNPTNPAKLPRVRGDKLEENPSFVPPIFEKTKKEKRFIRKSIENISMFDDLPEKELEPILDAFERVEYQEGETIAEQGEKEAFFYIIQNGEVSFNANGDEVAKGKKGDAFGGLALVHPSVRGSSVKAQNQTVMFRVESTNYRRIKRHTAMNSVSEKIKLLHDVPFFKNVSDSDLKQLSSAMVRHEFNAGDDLAKTFAGVPFCLVQTGKVFAADVRGSQNQKALVGPGGSFGEESLDKKKPPLTNITAFTSGVAFTIDHESFEKVFGDIGRLKGVCADKKTLVSTNHVWNIIYNAKCLEMLTMFPSTPSRRSRPSKLSKIAIFQTLTWTRWYVSFRIKSSRPVGMCSRRTL
jgi:CRP-like cAMP-binding protein